MLSTMFIVSSHVRSKIVPAQIRSLFYSVPKAPGSQLFTATDDVFGSSAAPPHTQ